MAKKTKSDHKATCPNCGTKLYRVDGKLKWRYEKDDDAGKDDKSDKKGKKTADDSSDDSDDDW